MFANTRRTGCLVIVHGLGMEAVVVLPEGGFRPVNSLRRHSVEIDSPSMNSRHGSLSNSWGAIFTLPDRLPAPRMM